LTLNATGLFQSDGGRLPPIHGLLMQNYGRNFSKPSKALQKLMKKFLTEPPKKTKPQETEKKTKGEAKGEKQEVCEGAELPARKKKKVHSRKIAEELKREVEKEPRVSSIDEIMHKLNSMTYLQTRLTPYPVATESTDSAPYANDYY
jgi:hypothetical protein